mmetsp:Transcript_21652/g.31513  ORF Transcript_21652/g.31513 Transcript_21652/m.31513 type:complete len:141 (+) Transcript_21652:188-610(+)
MVLEDSQKIGVGLLCLGLGFISIGMIMLFDSAMIAIGNTLFLCGLYFSIGLKRTISLFTRPDRIRGTICFFLGIALVLFRYPVVGMILESFGILNLFGNFLPTILNFARQVPGLSVVLDFPVVSQVADFIAGKTRSKYSV